MIWRFVPNEVLFSLFADLETVSRRICHELSWGHLRDSHPCFQQKQRFVTRHISCSNGIVDLGCASGRDTYWLSSITSAPVLGIDYNKELIDRAKAAYAAENLFFAVGDILDFMSSESSSRLYDTVFLSHILEHIEDAYTLLESLSTAFVWCYIEVPDIVDSDPLVGIKIEYGVGVTYSDDDHVCEFTRSSIEELISRSGWMIVDREYLGSVSRFWCKSKSLGEVPKA